MLLILTETKPSNCVGRRQYCYYYQSISPSSGTFRQINGNCNRMYVSHCSPTLSVVQELLGVFCHR